MTNNDVLRRLRYTLDLSDSTMIAVFGQADLKVGRDQVSNWLKKDDDADHEPLDDQQLATFLNGLINHKRGKKDGPQPVPEKKLTNNIILKKLKIAFDLDSIDMLQMIGQGGLTISKHELSAFFRKADHKHFRKCKDQVLRNFLQGLQVKLRPGDDEEKQWEEAIPESETKPIQEASSEKKTANQAVWSKVSVPD
ncbi:MAG: Glutamate synthase [NADPH] large chain (EC [uncultured Thiotrichaceae bacterium]|uniref:Glutamate synthase [NADPH] large chain (EC) n=1 Tax=uncultured Thiotrichaceae bacterium TaxID=298394 RepID=A0A6S6TSD7_9GAMM|nr:MAG: Glutamate synthase [NADPH] large chain (EC [uncultured Thiotrichaceae bacterium]